MKADGVTEDVNKPKQFFYFESFASHTDAEKAAMVRNALFLMLAAKVLSTAK